MTTSIMKLSKKIIKWAAVTAFWLAVWQLLAVYIDKEILIPTPSAAFLTLIRLSKTAVFWKSVLGSMQRIVAGFLIAVISGVIGAVLSNRFSVIKALMSPILHIIRAVPVASFIILALVWIKSPYLPMFTSFLMVLPIIWSNVENGIENVDKKLLEMAKVYRLSPLKVLFNIKIPSVFPSFLAASITSLGFAWKSGIAAEVICRPDASLGGLLQDAKIYLETPEVFALTAVMVILSLLLEIIIKLAVRGITNDKY